MTNAKNETLETAKENCREALAEARRHQAELGVPEDEQCKLPPTFNYFRSVERINALTAEYEQIEDDCREKLIAENVKYAELCYAINRLYADLQRAHHVLGIEHIAKEWLCEHWEDLGIHGLELLHISLDTEYCKLQQRLADAARADKRREKIAAKAKAAAAAAAVAKTVEKPRPMSAIEELERKREPDEGLAYACAWHETRKRCDSAFTNLQRLERKAGLTVTPSRSHWKFELNELTQLESEYRAKSVELAKELPKPEAKPAPVVMTAKVVAKVEEPEPVIEVCLSTKPTPPVITTKAEKKTPQPEFGKARLKAAETYKQNLLRLARIEGKFYRNHELYREQPLALTKRELRELTAQISERIEVKLTPKQLPYNEEVAMQKLNYQLRRRSNAA